MEYISIITEAIEIYWKIWRESISGILAGILGFVFTAVYEPTRYGTGLFPYSCFFFLHNGYYRQIIHELVSHQFNI